MSHEAVETIEYEKDGVKRRILIHYDDNPENPRKAYGHPSVMIGWGRYGCTDDEKTQYRHSSEFEEAWNEYDEFKDALRLPVSYFSHGMTRYFVGAPNDPWDSGQSGWIYCTRETIEKEWTDTDGKTADEWAIEHMTMEVETFSLWAQGNVYGFAIEKLIPACDHGHSDEWVDDDDTDYGCWGFIGEHPTYGGAVEAACEACGIPVPDEFKEREAAA